MLCVYIKNATGHWSSLTSLALGSSGAWASFVCLMFSTIFLKNEWLLFSFFVISTSNMNHKHLVRVSERERWRLKHHTTPLKWSDIIIATHLGDLCTWKCMRSAHSLISLSCSKSCGFVKSGSCASKWIMYGTTYSGKRDRSFSVK